MFSEFLRNPETKGMFEVLTVGRDSRVTAEQSEQAQDCGAPEGRKPLWGISDRKELSPLQGSEIASITFIFNSQFIIAFLREIPW